MPELVIGWNKEVMIAANEVIETERFLLAQDQTASWRQNQD